MKIRYQAAIVFAISAVALIALRSRDCLFVDGATRCLAVFRRQQIFFHPNNHLLYPVNVFLWTRLMAVLGFPSNTPLDYLLTVELLNCLAAAGCLAILYALVRRVTLSAKIATGVTAGFGLTGAFLAQATNANEPMLGVFWSLMGVLLAALSMDAKGAARILLILTSGLLFALAMATYRSTVLLAPAALVLLFSNSSSDSEAPSISRSRLAKSVLFALAAFTGCVAIFGWAYARMNTAPAAMVTKFLHQGDERAYLGISGSKVLNVPLALVRNCFPVLPTFTGLQNLLHGPKSTILLTTCLTASVLVALWFVGLTLVRHRNELTELEKLAILTATTGLTCTIIPVLVWDPHYGKLWIQPLICLALIVAVAVKLLVARRAWISTVVTALGLLFICGAALNLSWTIRNRAWRPFEFDEAHRLTGYIRQNDLVVVEWNSVAVLYGNLWANDDRFLSFVDEAVARGDGVMKELDDAVHATRAAGGKIFFLGVLDTPKPAWDSFLGTRCGVSYDALGRYRRAAQFRARMESRTGPVSLWEVNLIAGNDDTAAEGSALFVGEGDDWVVARRSQCRIDRSGSGAGQCEDQRAH